jgi:predicted nucleic acid-binding protein
MRGVLPDTTVWADFFNSKTQTPEKTKLIAYINHDYSLYVCPPVYQEVLQGISLNAAKAFKISKKQLSKLRRGRVGINQATDKAIEIYRTLRTKGYTIRKPNDCLIAAYAILNDLAVLHHDRDFDTIEKYYGLQVVHC